LQARELRRVRRRDEIAARRQDLPELDEHPAAVLERAAKANGRGQASLAVDTVVAPARHETDRRTEPVTDGDARDLRVPAHAPAAPLQRSERAGDRREAALGA